MSPVASNGPLHSRGSSLNGGVPVNAASGSKAKGMGMDGMKGANRVFLHLDDLLASKPNVDMNWPMRRLLQEGELLAKQADTHLDFRRPDVALQEYIKASILAVELIPRHKDYPSLHTDRGDLHRLYTGLRKRINAQHEKFAGVKQVIKENNARSGVKPTVQTGSGGTGTETQSNGMVNGNDHAQPTHDPTVNGSSTNGTPPRKKPPVQPKPESLHGNAIHPTNGNSIPQADLAARFARLRTPEPKPAIQDPRIRTRPISIPTTAGSSTNASQPGNYSTINRPTGPRDLPSVPRTLPRSTPIKLDTEIPGLPKPPAAVYDSPIRGPESAAANLLSSRSSSYRISGKEDLAPPISTVGPTPTLVDNRSDYFSFAQPAHTFGDDSYGQKAQKAPVLSDSPTVTAEELVDLLAQSSPSFRILLVDLRSREDFETGHIMSQFIICVEPITLKNGISGDQLGESMVIAPDLEQNLYDQRHEFDLLVFYDQSSDSLNPSHLGSGETENTLKDFVSAVFDYGYEKRVKRRPKLLAGGLDAWVDILGSNSLKSSLDGATTSRNRVKPSRPLSRHSMGHSSRNIPVKRRRTYASRPLSKEEEKKWANALKEEHAIQSPVVPEDTNADDLVYARTTEEFFRRYPELPAIQESMTKPVSVPSAPKTYQDEFARVMPKPPARPAPALPRQRSSGISERGPIATYAHTTGDTITQSRVPPGLTGIENPHNLCYMNAAIQAMSATPFLRDLLMNYQHPPQTPIPRKRGETSDPPQLMVRCLGSVLTHLWNGQYDYVTPTTLRGYVNTVHVGKQINARIRDRGFGGSSRQHDSVEFFLFVIDILMDELNPTRDKPDWILSSELERQSLNSEPSRLWAANQFRQKILYNNTSPLVLQTDIMEMSVIICNNCGKERRNFQNNPMLKVTVRDEPPVQRLVDALVSDIGPRSRGALDFGCEHCGKRKPGLVNGQPRSPIVVADNGTIYRYHTWLPDYLWISLNRYGLFGNEIKKIETTFRFDETGIDLTETFAPALAAEPRPLPRQQTGPFKYDVYAVIQHRGNNISHGHYWTLARSFDKPRSGAGSWHKFNDSSVTAARFEDTQSDWTSAIFLRRQGS